MILLKIGFISMGLMFCWLILAITGVIDILNDRNEKILGILGAIALMGIIVGLVSMFPN